MIFTLSVTSKLAEAPMEVWHRVNTLAGVNTELMPLLKMTAPIGKERLPFTQVPLQQPLFASWLLLFGIFPFDRHQLQFDQVWEGGFRENSKSLVHRAWRHDRTIVSTDAGCTLIDSLQFEPRIPLFGYILLPTVRYVFRHRHRRLLQLFGALGK